MTAKSIIPPKSSNELYNHSTAKVITGSRHRYKAFFDSMRGKSKLYTDEVQLLLSTMVAYYDTHLFVLCGSSMLGMDCYWSSSPDERLMIHFTDSRWTFELKRSGYTRAIELDGSTESRRTGKELFMTLTYRRRDPSESVEVLPRESIPTTCSHSDGISRFIERCGELGLKLSDTIHQNAAMFADKWLYRQVDWDLVAYHQDYESYQYRVVYVKADIEVSLVIDVSAMHTTAEAWQKRLHDHIASSGVCDAAEPS